MIDLYSHCDGGDILEGNLQLYPLDGSDFSVTKSSSFLRNNQWPIPEELVVFAGDGTGDSFGLWLPTAEHHAPLVIEVGGIFEEGSFAIVGTSLSAFLRGRTAYYLLLLECPAQALDALEVPRSLRAGADELGDDEYDALARWSDPGLPQLPLSAYRARLTARDIRDAASRRLTTA